MLARRCELVNDGKGLVIRFRKLVQGQMPHWLNRIEVRRVDLPLKVTFWAVLLIRIRIREE